MIDFDEISKLAEEKITQHFEINEQYENGWRITKHDKEELEDDIEELLIMALAFGEDDLVQELGLQPSDLTAQRKYEILYQPVAGKTWKERSAEYTTPQEYKVMVDTEVPRVYNTGKFEYAENVQEEIKKMWRTYGDEKVRETHAFLDDVAVPLDERFYTYDGDSALYPSGFERPENNINCRCILQYTR